MSAQALGWRSLTRWRTLIQAVMLVVTVYGGTLTGHYLADKVSNELPALSCAYDQKNGAYCVLIPLQHQMHHRVGEGFVRAGEFAAKMLLPTFFSLLSFFLFFVVLNKAFCAWVCPLGTVQEWLFKLGRWLKLGFHRLTGRGLGRTRPVKWGFLLILVLALPLAAGLGYAPHAAGDAFCQICPSRVVTTLLTGTTEQMAVGTLSGADFFFSAVRNALFGFVIIAAMAVRQPFCRICPMLALHALFRRLAFFKLAKREDERCGKCNLCERACPMDIPEIASEHGPKAFHEDCTLCGRCAEYCPGEGIIQLKLGPAPLFQAAPAYFKARSKMETPEGAPRKRKE